jgi:hypothetical protein
MIVVNDDDDDAVFGAGDAVRIRENGTDVPSIVTNDDNACFSLDKGKSYVN